MRRLRVAVHRRGAEIFVACTDLQARFAARLPRHLGNHPQFLVLQAARRLIRVSLRTLVEVAQTVGILEFALVVFVVLNGLLAVNILFLLWPHEPAVVAAECLADILMVRVHAMLAVADVVIFQDDARLSDDLVVAGDILLVRVGLFFVVAAAGSREYFHPFGLSL